jgi:hypothetical protein
MIQGQIFNFELNKLEASKYRNELQNIEGDLTSSGVESFLINGRFNFKKLNFSFLTRRNIADAQLIDTNFRNLSYYLNYVNKNLNSIKEYNEVFNKKTKEFFKVFNKDLEELHNAVKETSLKLSSKYNKVKIYSIFKEKDFLESYDLMDLKRGLRFRKNQQCSFKNDAIETKEIYKEELDIVSIEIIKEKSSFSDKLEALNVDLDTSKIFRKDKFWNYIVALESFLEDLQELPHKDAKLTLIVNFDGYCTLDNIFVEFGSSLPVTLNENNIKYYDRATSSYIALKNTYKKETTNKSNIFFDSIRASKIMVELIQKKYHDTAFVKEGAEKEKVKKLLNRSYLNHQEEEQKVSIKRVYDFSILNFSCKRSSNEEIGFYREASPTLLNKPLSLNLKTKEGYKSEGCFIEKYLHIVLYGEENYTAFKKKSKNFSNTKRANVIIPICESSYKEEEVLCLKDEIGRLLFYPDTSQKIKTSVKVYKTKIDTGEKSLLDQNGYEYSLDGGSNFLSDKEIIPKSSSNININKEIYNFCIKILNPSSSYYYSCEYILDEEIECGYSKDILIKQGELIFNRSFQSSVGFARPVFILRNKSVSGNSSKIGAYEVLVEEMEENEKSFIEYETFVEMERRGSSNVI